MGIEIWKDIVGFEERYEVSNLGKVRSKKTGRLLSFNNKSKQVNLQKNNESLMVTLKHLIAVHFCVNPNNYRFVACKDGNPLNLIASNLEYQPNMKKNYKSGELSSCKHYFSNFSNEDNICLSIELIKDYPSQDGIYIVYCALDGEIFTTIGYCANSLLKDRDGEPLLYDSLIGYSELPKI